MTLKLRSHHPAGFTLVELLVVIAIIGILISLLLPAVQGAREAGRRATCLNNLTNLAKAAVQHVEKHGHFPSGGWGSKWIGEPDRGYGEKQPGGWLYNLLPYLDQQNLRELKPSVSADGLTIVQTPLAIVACPSRRRAALYPGDGAANNLTSAPSTLAKSDYAVNAGSGPASSTDGPSNLAGADTFTFPAPGNGVSYARSQVKAAQMQRDGTSNTYFAGEKYVPAMLYTVGGTEGDKRGQFVGYSNDNFRWTALPPLNDTDDDTSGQAFGSPHPSTVQFAFCDGSVRPISVTIDPTIHAILGSRDDRQVVDASKL